MAVLIPYSALADTSAGVVITVSGNVSGLLGLPSNFTVTYINDCEIQITWTKGLGATNTMVRSAVGREPVDRYDGRLIYYGTGTSVNDIFCTQVVDKPIYYTAWSEGVGGWAGDPATGNVAGGREVTLIGFVVFGLGLTWFATSRRFLIWNIAAAVTWVALWSYMKANPPGGIAEGSSVQLIIMLVPWILAVGVMIYGVYKQTSYQRDIGGGLTVGGEEGRWHLPEWTKGSEFKYQKRKRTRQTDLDAYQEKFHRALNPGEGNNRRGW